MIALMNPATRTRGMRQRNSDRFSARMLDVMLTADQLIERKPREKFFDGQFADGQQQARPYEPQLVLEPGRAVRAFGRRRDPVTAAARAGPRIAARYRGDLDAIPRGALVQADSLEPPKERLARAAGEGLAAIALHLSRRLPDEHYSRTSRERHDRHHVRAELTAPTGCKRAAMARELSIELVLPNGHAKRYGGR